MTRLMVQLILFFILIVLAFQPQQNLVTMNMDTDFSQPSKRVTVNYDDLYKEIQERSKEFEVPPQDAEIHKVWKKTPGLNGLKVNVEKSFENMKDKGKFDESLLVFEQVQPEVSIEDLPASPIYRGHPDKQMVTLLINVAWGSDNIPSILNTLKKQDVKANFFIEGKWASANTSLVKMIKEEGHTIGNHAYNHPDMKQLSKNQNLEQMEKTNDIIKAIIEDEPKWFAPPSGSFNDQVVKTASELEMETILWSVDTVDWKKPTTSVMVKRVMSNIHSGATILMHPTEVIEQGLDDLILNIKEKGYKIVPIERLLSEKR